MPRCTTACTTVVLPVQLYCRECFCFTKALFSELQHCLANVKMIQHYFAFVSFRNMKPAARHFSHRQQQKKAVNEGVPQSVKMGLFLVHFRGCCNPHKPKTRDPSSGVQNVWSVNTKGAKLNRPLLLPDFPPGLSESRGERRRSFAWSTLWEGPLVSDLSPADSFSLT